MPYVCDHCRRSAPAFSLLCTECGSWNTLRSDEPSGSRAVALSQIEELAPERIRSGIAPLDALLGDGFVPGSSVLLIGPPGAGKSTLAMQILKRMGVPALHVTGEDSVRQLKLRADRLKLASENLFLLLETNVQRIVPHVEGMKVLIIDPIQTLSTDTSDTLPGSSTQIRRCASLLCRLAQEKNLVLILIGQVSREKKAAGPRILEHAVDVVLHLEIGDRPHRRILTASKNRFGTTPGRCELTMRSSGLIFSRTAAQ